MELEVIEELNSKLKAYELLHFIGYRTDTIVITEDQIIAFCPIDKIDNKGSCVINRKTGKFECKHCFKKGNLVELYAWSKTVSIEKAVNELKSNFGLALESQLKKKESFGKKGTHFERYIDIKNEVMKMENNKSAQYGTQNEWLSNAMKGTSAEKSHVAKNNLPDISKFHFRISSDNDFFLNRNKCEYREFNSIRSEELNTIGNKFISQFIFKSSSVKLFENLLKNKILWMWGLPYVVFQSYDCISYFSPFYTAKYSPFQEIRHNDKIITLDEYILTLKRDNFSEFKLINFDGEEFLPQHKVVSENEAFKETIRFIRNLKSRFGIDLNNIKIVTDSIKFIVYINPYIFGQTPSKFLDIIYENLFIELTSTVVDKENKIEHTDYKSLNLNVYNPGHLLKTINFSSEKGYMTLLNAEKIVDLTFEELAELMQTKSIFPTDLFFAVNPDRKLKNMFTNFTKEAEKLFSNKKFEVSSNDHEKQEVKVGPLKTKIELNNSAINDEILSQKNSKIEQKVESEIEIKPKESSSGNFIVFFKNNDFFDDETITTPPMFIRKSIPTGNVYLDKMLGGGFLTSHMYFISSHDFIYEYLFISKILESFFKTSPANYVITDNKSDFSSLKSVSQGKLKILKSDISNNELFVKELLNMNFSSLLFIHSLDFAIKHVELLRKIRQPLLIYSNTERYDEYEKIVFFLRKGSKYIEAIDVEPKSYKSKILYGKNNKLEVEKFDIPLIV